MAASETRDPSASRLAASVCAILLTLSAGRAAAQDGASVDIQNFTPALGPYAVFTTEGADTLGHLSFAGGAMLNYSSEPLVARNDDGLLFPVVDQQLGVHLLAGVGLLGRLQLDLQMPVYLVHNGLYNGEPFSGVTPGDLAVRVKGRILSSKEGPVGLGAIVEARAPTGNSEAFVGTGGVTVVPKLLADTRLGPVFLAANVGVALLPEQSVRNLDLGFEMTYSLGAEVTFLEGLLALGGDLYGRTQLAGPFANPSTSPLEGVLGLKLKTPSGFSVISGAGGGLIGGFGAPEFRAFVGLSYASEAAPEPTPEPEPAPIDVDEDGITGDQDKCPDEPEDFDKFEDEDGCPEPDNDQDGVPDREDECKNQAGDAAQKGCPIQDKDADGILDKSDLCPEKPEDKDGWQDEDGCPDPDNDSDKVVDQDDQCKDEAEDPDGFQDEDGCPDPDNDQDGILDAEDKCPNKAETYNGATDADGCPDGEAIVEIPGGRALLLKQPVRFKPRRATLLKNSNKILDTVVTVLTQNPRLTRVRVEAHTSDVGDAAKNLKLSGERAAAVQAYLVKKGIAPSRLIVEGFGSTKPSCQDLPELTKTKRAKRKNKTAIKACRKVNERVALTVLEIDGKAVGVDVSGSRQPDE